MTFKPFHFLLLIFSMSCFAQEYRVNGYVKDVNNNPIAYANVVITKNSEGIEGSANGTSTDESGYFIIESLSAGNYTLKISFLGYTTYTKAVDLDGHTKFDTVVLEENLEALDDVTIVAKRPTVKRLVDRLVFNVENSTLSNNNVLDVLKHTPGVLVHDGSITIKNSTPTVYINDRRVHLSSSEVQQLLEGTSATNVKSIEVITNPPAKYEAEGGAVLNIVTSKNIVAGYNGSVFGDFKQGSEFPKYSFGTSHFFKTKKLNTYINYNINPRKDYRFINEAVNFIENNQIISSWNSNSDKRSKSKNQNIKFNLDYDLNENNSIGFSANALVSPREATKIKGSSLTEVFNSNKTLDSTFNTINNKVNETFNLAFTLDYVHKFNNEGEKISTSMHHTNYDFSDFQDVNTGYFLPNTSVAFRNNKFQTFSSQEIKLYTGQIDYELPINDSAKLEAGGKVSNINSESIINQFTFTNDIKEIDLENSDTFLYDETNYAIYTSYSKDWDSWSLKSGLRLEFTDIEGNSLSTNQISANNYIKLFPSFYILNKLNENNKLYFNYNRRIHRPRYSQLNPFKYFLNDNTYVTGDPNLKPQIDDVFILGYTFKEDYTFELYYRYEKNPTLQFINQDNIRNLLIYTNTNTDLSISYGIDFTTYTEIASYWSLYVLSSIYYYKNNFFVTESNDLYSADIWSLYTEVSSYFSLLKDKSLSVDVSYMIMSPTNDGPTDTSTISGLDISVRKNLWNNRASVSLGLSDVFNTRNFTTITKYLNQDIFSEFKKENKLFTIGFIYKFGNFRLNNNSKGIDLIERERLGNNN